jgi:hypothetical protein
MCVRFEKNPVGRGGSFVRCETHPWQGSLLSHVILGHHEVDDTYPAIVLDYQILGSLFRAFMPQVRDLGQRKLRLGTTAAGRAPDRG